MKALFSCITLEMIAELGAMNGDEHQGMLAYEILCPALTLLDNACRGYQILPHPARLATKVDVIPGSFDVNGAQLAVEVTPQIIVNLEGIQQGVTVLWLPPAQQERNMRNVW